MKKLVLIQVLLCFYIACFADSEVVDSINGIKKNPAYLYGEATKETFKSSDSLAKTDLILKIQEWVFKYTDKLVDEKFDQRVTPYVRTLSTPRADKIRVFAYVQKADVMPLLRDMGIVFTDSTVKRIPDVSEPTTSKNEFTQMLNDIFKQSQKDQVSPQDESPKPQTRNEVLKRLLKAKDFFELREIMKKLIEQGAITKYGRRHTCKLPEECYWVVYDRAGNIKAILSKGKKMRKNYMTDRNDELSNYEGKGYAGIWFQIAEKTKTIEI